MIKSWEELGEILAEFENRLSYLENSQHFHYPEDRPEPKPVFRPRPIHDEIDQLKAGFLYLQKNVNAISDKKIVDKQGKYKRYI
ncbi:hypothetical protein LCGC14_1578000 [marine sediment metagenome]|uniref:Uncharacterized protein n=1 Tax=marine sediment metagenome TaxID=412755 RepID=A0A0F9LHZ1_9ZZZZ